MRQAKSEEVSSDKGKRNEEGVQSPIPGLEIDGFTNIVVYCYVQ